MLAELDQLLADNTIEELWLNSPDAVFVARSGVAERIPLRLSAAEVALWVERLLIHSNRRLDLSSPFVDATLSDGSRLHVAIAEVVRDGWAVNIRKFSERINRLADLVEREVMDERTALLLEAVAADGYNIIVAGGTGAGKTTLLNCLLASVPAEERVITCEEVFELSVGQVDRVALQTRPPSLEGNGEINLRELVRQSLRMRPSRLVVGEVRSAESLDLLLALNSGQPGMATIHANSAAEAVLKLCTLPLLAGKNVSSDFVVPTVASSVDILVQVARDFRGHRSVVEVAGLTGRISAGRPELVTLIRKQANSWQVRNAQLPKSEVRGGRVDAAAIWSAIAEPIERVESWV